MYVRMDGRTDKGDAICPPIINGGGIKSRAPPKLLKDLCLLPPFIFHRRVGCLLIFEKKWHRFSKPEHLQIFFIGGLVKRIG